MTVIEAGERWWTWRAPAHQSRCNLLTKVCGSKRPQSNKNAKQKGAQAAVTVERLLLAVRLQ